MIEREMEDLIANYPDDFFPDKGFKLSGRQRSFAGVGQFDLLFEDRFNTNVLMELKAVPAKYDVATQLAKYKDELQIRGEQHILMWLIAPNVPTSVREFLDRIGIEYTEIHVAEFRRVAGRRGYPISSEESGAESSVAQKERPILPGSTFNRNRNTSDTQVMTRPRVAEPSMLRWKAYGYDLALANPEAFEESTFGDLVGAFERSVPSGRNAALVSELRRWASNPGLLHWPHKCNSSLLRWVTTSSYKSAVPRALAIWKYMFGLPAPGWYVWTQSGGYQFDRQGWQEWLDSLNQDRFLLR